MFLNSNNKKRTKKNSKNVHQRNLHRHYNTIKYEDGSKNDFGQANTHVKVLGIFDSVINVDDNNNEAPGLEPDISLNGVDHGDGGCDGTKVHIADDTKAQDVIVGGGIKWTAKLIDAEDKQLCLGIKPMLRRYAVKDREVLEGLQKCEKEFVCSGNVRLFLVDNAVEFFLRKHKSKQDWTILINILGDIISCFDNNVCTMTRINNVVRRELKKVFNGKRHAIFIEASINKIRNTYISLL